MRGNGEADWIISLHGVTLDSSTLLSDSCQGMVFDKKSETIVTVVQTNSPQFRVEDHTS